MIVMGAELEALACEALGRSWKKMLAKELGCTKRTIIRAVKGRKGIPVAMQKAFLELLSKQRGIFDRAQERLGSTMEDAA